MNLRYIFRLIGAFISRFKILILVSIGAGFLIFFILRLVMPLVTAGYATKIGETGRFTPASLPVSVLRLISGGLTKLDKDGSVVPDMASSWETTDKGKTWTFKIKNGLTWQDGTKVTSKTINYQFSDVTIQRPDDYTIVFQLQNPYSAFPSVVSRPTFKSGLLGTGEWKVTKISLNGSIVEELDLSSKSLGKLTYKFYPTEDRTRIAYELGQVNKIDELFKLSPFDTWNKVKISSVTDTGEFAAVFFNTQDKLLSDKNVRQALTYGIDKSRLGGERAISPISVDSWAYNPQVKPYDYDAIKAKQMINDYKKSSKLSEININLYTSPLLLDKAEIISGNWQAIGVNVNLQVVSNVPSDFQAFLAIFDIPDDPDQYSIWHSTQTATNITHYQNPRIDKLLEDGRSEIDLESRKKIYLDFQRFLVEDCPAAFLYYPTTFSVSRK